MAACSCGKDCTASAGDIIERIVRSTGRASTPIDDFGFVNFESVGIVGGEAGHLANSAVDVEHHPADPADQVVVVVADPTLVATCRARRLDAANQVLVDQNAERVIDRLPRDGAELGAHDVAQLVGCGMWVLRNDAHDRESLSGDLDAVLAQEFCCWFEHEEDLITDFGLCQISAPVRFVVFAVSAWRHGVAYCAHVGSRPARPGRVPGPRSDTSR